MITSQKNVTKHVGYIKSRDMLSNYIVKHMIYSVEIVYALQHQKYPVTQYVNNYALKLLGDTLAKVLIEEMILKDKIKEYFVRKRNILSNVNTIFALVWGKCSESL